MEMLFIPITPLRTLKFIAYILKLHLEYHRETKKSPLSYEIVILGCECGACRARSDYGEDVYCCKCGCGECGSCPVSFFGKVVTSYCCICRCFPGKARVSLENGNSLTMSELQVGDKVQTGKGKCFLVKNTINGNIHPTVYLAIFVLFYCF